MRKQTKILVATALLALGASFTSMAAAKTGTWMLEDDGWYCYDKEGEAWEDEFCLSYGKEYYMGDDGLMVTSSWVDYEENTYFVGSDGSKTISDWRFLVPEDADEDEDEEWFYFDTKGRMVTGKKVIDGKTYYFNEDGVMLTGWVSYSDSSKQATEAESITGAVYCDENGARVATSWVKTWAPGTDLEDAEEDDKAWYYIKSTGAATLGRARDINGETYFFGQNGKMLSGWVGTDDAGETYFAMGTEVSPTAISDVDDAYFCGTSDQGWAKKDRWIKTWAPADYYEKDSDDDQFWYYFAKSGKVYAPDEASAADATELKFADGTKSAADLTVEGAFTASDADEKVALKEIDKKVYAFNEEGEMLKGFVNVTADACEATNGAGLYYFGGEDDGSMKIGSIMIEDNEGGEWKFFFNKTNTGANKGTGVTGAASGELYENGLIQKASENAYEIKDVVIGSDVVYFLVDKDGDIRTTKKEFEADDEVYLNTEAVEFNTNLTGTREDSIKDIDKVTYKATPEA